MHSSENAENFADNSPNDQQLKSLTAFDKVLQQGSNNSMVKMNTIKSGSRQKNRMNKVILPKIMFYNQTTKPEVPSSIENSERLIFMEKGSIDHFPSNPNSAPGNPLDSSIDTQHRWPGDTSIPNNLVTEEWKGDQNSFD